MEKHSLYEKIISPRNIFLAYKKARKGKTKKAYVKEFEENLYENILKLHEELKKQTYKPNPLKIFILRDPKTRKISKSDFKDRIVHHAIVRIIEPFFEKIFIYDSCASRIGKGNLFALERFELFKRKVTNNLQTRCFCLKADIKHYFEEVDHEILINIIKRKINDEKVIWLIRKVLGNLPCGKIGGAERDKGMPLGNLISQFFANVYLNELDYLVKHKLKAKYYIRYVDDFVILNGSKEQLNLWKEEINSFLQNKLRIELHHDKSRIISLSRGIDFVGFRNFYYFRLLRKRNVKNMIVKIIKYKNNEICKEKLLESFQGWNAYAKWANSYNLRKRIIGKIYAE